MSRVPRGRRMMAGLLASSLLIALAVMPGSGLSGKASAVESCPTIGDSEVPTCYLDIEGVPASVADGALFTFQVNVEDASDGSGSVVEGDCSSEYIIVTDGVEGLELTDLPVQAVNGVATFTDVSLTGAGVHTLYATVPFASCYPTVEDDSQTLEVTEGGTVTVECPEVGPCVLPLITSPGGTTARIDAGTDATSITAFFSTIEEAGFTNCKGTNAGTDDVLTFNVVGSIQPKTITVVYPRTPGIKICWHTDSPFKQRNGKIATEDPLGGYTGLLPNCNKKHPMGPCILSIKTPRNGLTTTVQVLAPAGDPVMKR